MAKPVRKHTWSNMDVFGLLNGLATWDEQYKSLKYVRKPFEKNIDIKTKIFSSHDAPSDVTKQGLLNGLSVEFDLDSYNVETASTFTLSIDPVPSGAPYVQDVFGYYKQPGETSWTSIGPQIWPDQYNSAKKDGIGFICWQNEKYTNISGYKNYRYSNLIEVLRTDLEDRTQFQFVYYVYVSDSQNNRKLVQFTDMNNQEDPDDTRFTYRKAIADPSLSGQVVVYTLNDIPETIKWSKYYEQNTGIAKKFLYDLKAYIDKKFKHTWDKIIDKSSIWDVHINYGSGHIPHFYDAIAPRNADRCELEYSGYTGGIEELSYSLYPEDIIESGTAQNWYLKIYPGRFYIDGLAYYYFEEPQTDYITFSPAALSGIEGTLVSGSLPSGVKRGAYTILSLSGYHSSSCNRSRDPFLPNVYEDYSYYNGPDGDSFWSNIYRRRPYLTSQRGFSLQYGMGDYFIDYESNIIYAILPSGHHNATLIWDNKLVPSGSLLRYDINPLNDQNLNFSKFFMYLTLDPNRR